MPEGLLLIFSVMWNHQLRFCVSANVSEVPVGRGQEFCLRTGNAAMPGRELTDAVSGARGQDSGRTCLPSCAPGVSANLQSPTHPAPGSPSAAPEAAPVAS